MANITREQVQKINEKMHNNWKFDLMHYLSNSGDKSATKRIELDEKHFIEAALWFSKKYENFRPVGLEITLNISYYTAVGNGLASSSGMGIFRKIPYTKARKSFADLQKLTAIIDDAYIMAIYNSGNNKEKCLDNILLDKSGWHIHEV